MMLPLESQQRIWAGDLSFAGEGWGQAGARPAGPMGSVAVAEESVIQQG